MLKEIVINKNYKNLMLQKLARIEFVDSFLDNKNFKKKISDIVEGTLQAALTDSLLKDSLNALVLRDLPLDESIPETPLFSSDTVIGKMPIAQLMLLSLATNLGTAIGFSSENNGAIIHNISPMKDKMSTRSGQGYQEMGMHSDFAFSDEQPDWLILMCLRNTQKLPTRISFINDVCASLTEQELDMLMEPNFLIFPPDSSSIKEPRVSAILFKRGENFISRFNQDKCKGKTEEAQRVLNKFTEIALSQSQKVLLNPGDVLIFDNKATLHSRESFKANYDGNDRWIQRVYCKNKSMKEIEIIQDLAA